MTIQSMLSPGKIPAILLLCVMLGACSTTQKSSSGAGTQDAAPISEAGKSDTTPAPASPSSSSQSTPAASSAGAAAAAATPPGKGDEEAERLKQQLSDQEAQINRLREDQVDAQRLAEDEAARRRLEEAAAASPTITSPPPDSAAGTAQSSGAAAGAAGAAGSSSSAAAEASSAQTPPADQPLQRSVYFDYDSSRIPEQYDSMLVGHAAFLRAHPDFNAEVQGNCDDRGSREYNLALGARRAESVKKALELAGADGSRIKTVSFGAEKPIAFGQDEESYRQNRRADIQY